MDSKLAPSLIMIMVCATICQVHSQNGYGWSPPKAPSVSEGQSEDKVKVQGQPNPNWWMTQDAFQKPSNHPGVTRSEGETPVPPNPPPLIPPPSPECMLRVKSDCHGGHGGGRATQVDGLPANYQLDGFGSYPVYTAYVVPAIGSFSSPPIQQQVSRVEPPPHQNSIAYSTPAQGSPTFDPIQPSSYGYRPNYEPLPPTPQGQTGPNKQVAYNYKPAVVPYKAPPSTHTSENGNAAGATNGDVLPPYPGCPAAMLCVKEDFCDANGVNAGKSIQLSDAEKLFRVVLAACSAPTTGEVGVCCRDPTYKDPWPMMEGGQDATQRQTKGMQFDDGQYRPQVYSNGKPAQFQGGQYRPIEHPAEQPRKVVIMTYDNDQYRPQGHFSRQHEPIQAHHQQPALPQVDQYPQHQQSFPYPQQPEQYPQYEPKVTSPQYQQGYKQQPGQYPQYEAKVTPQGGNPHQPAPVPAPAGQNPGPMEFGIRTGLPPRKGFVEVCPNSMKCLRESYCQQPNPNEGNVKLFDIRIGTKGPSRLKCRQDNLPVDGVCCYLAEDYMSQVTTRPFDSIPSMLTEPIVETSSCGLRRHKSTAPRTEFGEFPWQARIRAGANICGGVIITSKIIATTASCVRSVSREDISIRLGEWDRGSAAEKKSHQDIRADEIILHPQFNPTSLTTNIALVVATEPIKFDYHVARICLPQPVTTSQGRKCTVTGWGSLHSNLNQRNSSSQILEQADVQVLNQPDCDRHLKSVGSRSSLSILCGIPEQTQNFCLGDEGSPLVCEMPNTGEYILTGFLIGNKEAACAQDGVVTNFTNVTALVDWVYKFIKQKG